MQKIPFDERLVCAEAGIFHDPELAIPVLKETGEVLLDDLLTQDQKTTLRKLLDDLKFKPVTVGSIITYGDAARLTMELYSEKYTIGPNSYYELSLLLEEVCLAGITEAQNRRASMKIPARQPILRDSSRTGRTISRISFADRMANAGQPILRGNSRTERTISRISLANRVTRAEQAQPATFSLKAFDLTVPEFFQAASGKERKRQLAWFYKNKIVPLELGEWKAMRKIWDSLPDKPEPFMPDLRLLIYGCVQAFKEKHISDDEYDDLLLNILVVPFL